MDCICVNFEKESEVRATELKEGERQCRTKRTEKRKDTCAHEHHTRKAPENCLTDGDIFGLVTPYAGELFLQDGGASKGSGVPFAIDWVTGRSRNWGWGLLAQRK